MTECDNANVVVVIRKTFPTKAWQWRQWPTNRIQRFRQPWLEMQRPFRAFFQDGSISYVQWPTSPALGTCFCSAKKRCLLRRRDYHHAGYWKSANHSFKVLIKKRENWKDDESYISCLSWTFGWNCSVSKVLFWNLRTRYFTYYLCLLIFGVAPYVTKTVLIIHITLLLRKYQVYHNIILLCTGISSHHKKTINMIFISNVFQTEIVIGCYAYSFKKK